MEVHAHSHTPGNKRTHYFRVFLLLSPCMCCGFLAEYQLEHTIEKDREKQYMRSLMEDLKADTAMLAGNIKIRPVRIQLIDTFLSLLYSPTAIRQRSGDVYYLSGRVSPPANIFTNLTLK